MTIKMRHDYRRRSDSLRVYTPGGCVIMLDMVTGVAVIGAALLGVHVECRWTFSKRRADAYLVSQGQRLGDALAQMIRESAEDEVDKAAGRHVGPVH